MWKQERASPEIEALFGTSQPVQQWSEVLEKLPGIVFWGHQEGETMQAAFHDGENAPVLEDSTVQLHLSSLLTTLGHLGPLPAGLDQNSFLPALPMHRLLGFTLQKGLVKLNIFSPLSLFFFFFF